MTVQQDRWLSRRIQPITVDDRMPSRRKKLNIVEADRPHMICNPIGTALHIRSVLLVGADTGDREEILQLSKVTVFILIKI
jgi:hypothetical protein